MTTLATFKAAGKTFAFHDVRHAIGAEVYGRLPYVGRVLAENIFDLVYKGEGGIVVSLARADRSPRHDD